MCSFYCMNFEHFQYDGFKLIFWHILNKVEHKLLKIFKKLKYKPIYHLQTVRISYDYIRSVIRVNIVSISATSTLQIT